MEVHDETLGQGRKHIGEGTAREGCSRTGKKTQKQADVLLHTGTCSYTYISLM